MAGKEEEIDETDVASIRKTDNGPTDRVRNIAETWDTRKRIGNIQSRGLLVRFFFYIKNCFTSIVTCFYVRIYSARLQCRIKAKQNVFGKVLEHIYFI